MHRLCPFAPEIASVVTQLLRDGTEVRRHEVIAEAGESRESGSDSGTIVCISIMALLGSVLALEERRIKTLWEREGQIEFRSSNRKV